MCVCTYDKFVIFNFVISADICILLEENKDFEQIQGQQAPEQAVAANVRTGHWSMPGAVNTPGIFLALYTCAKTQRPMSIYIRRIRVCDERLAQGGYGGSPPVFSFWHRRFRVVQDHQGLDRSIVRRPSVATRPSGPIQPSSHRYWLF